MLRQAKRTSTSPVWSVVRPRRCQLQLHTPASIMQTTTTTAASSSSSSDATAPTSGSAFFFRHDVQHGGRAYGLHPPRTIYPLVKTAHLDFGVEEVEVGSEIPWHHHDDKEEVIFVWRGQGQAYIETDQVAEGVATAGVESSDLQAGVTMYVPPRHRHRLVNTGAEPLWITWTFAPPGDGFEAALIKQKQSQPQA